MLVSVLQSSWKWLDVLLDAVVSPPEQKKGCCLDSGNEENRPIFPCGMGTLKKKKTSKSCKEGTQWYLKADAACEISLCSQAERQRCEIVNLCCDPTFVSQTVRGSWEQRWGLEMRNVCAVGKSSQQTALKHQLWASWLTLNAMGSGVSTAELKPQWAGAQWVAIHSPCDGLGLCPVVNMQLVAYPWVFSVQWFVRCSQR